MSKVGIIFGTGSNVGLLVAKKLTGKGFKVVTVSRKSVGPAGKLQNHIHLKADLGNLSAVSEVFSRVRELYGEPNLVIYNAAAYSVTDPNNAFVDSVEDFAQHLSVNTISLFETIKETIKSFDRLPRDINKTLIFTGNFLNRFPSASLLSLSVGKGASYDLLRLADMSYGKKGYKFYYADERTESGNAVYGDINGEAHAEFYYQLAEGLVKDVPVDATFVKGKGYTKF